MLKLASNPKNIVHIEKFIERVLDKQNVPAEVYGNILISVTEAVTNAIMHGNNADESKTVCISHQQKDTCLKIKIEDEGSGFDYDNVPDPTTNENRLKLGGRGVFLMKELSHKLEFFDNGSTVEIQFLLA